MKSNVLLLAACSLFFASCAQVGPTGGLVFHDIKYGITATPSVETVKRGEACQSSVLGLFGFGDASIDTAKKENGITNVSSVDASSFGVLGFYNKYCTIVKGN